jgi:hypothetical protein
MDYSGKIIKKTPVVPSQTSASGVWTLDDALQATKSNTWPVANVPDPISRSLRFRQSASAYLSRTFSNASTNRKKLTYSGWVKRGALGGTQVLLDAYDGSSAAEFQLSFNSSNSLDFTFGGAAAYQVSSSAIYRDPSAWYHIVLAIDTTQATAANRVIFYVNGTQITSYSTANYPPQNNDSMFPALSGNNKIGSNWNSGSGFLDGYTAETYFIDGQALDPTYFGGTNAVTGVWEPRQYTGTYGTNGFLLTFSDNTSTTTLGNDTSGNGNNWTTNNISLTAGSTYDSMLDVPTQWIGYNTGDVASVTRGNYAVMNPLAKDADVTMSNGNLQFDCTSGGLGGAIGTIAVSSGKWYWEVVSTAGAGSSIGIAKLPLAAYDANQTGTYLYLQGGDKRLSPSTDSAYGASWTTNDVIGIALDMDAGTVTFYKNNASQGTAFSSLSGDFTAWVQDGSGGSASTLIANFGQRPFSYTPPAGFLSLCTTNLPSSTILQGDDYFNAVLWTGNGASTIDVTGVGFQPDFVWAKRRSASDGHGLFDAVRGVNLWLQSNTTGAETTFGGNFGLLAFNPDGFQMGSGSAVNLSGANYVAWNWKASNAAGVTNTAGSITSTVSANQTSGFSIVTYTGNGSAGATIGHGLGATPRMIIVKARNASGQDWLVYHANANATPQNGVMTLNATSAFFANSVFWNNTAPTSSVFSVGTSAALNNSGTTYVAYCFAAVAGYSAFGSYTGNGSSDGPFVYTGFRPKYVMWKRTNTSGDSWWIIDSARSPENVADDVLLANLSNSESVQTTPIDFLSNGFKMRNGADGSINANGSTYIYMAFAENPFKNALAR